MDLIATKVLIAILFGVIRFIFGVLPIKTYFVLKKQAGNLGRNPISDRKRARLEFAMLLVQSFGSGVLFATCFLHLIPEVTWSFQLIKGESVNYPYVQLLISVGFFTTYFAEEVIQWLIVRETKESCEATIKSRASSAIVSKDNKVSPEFTKIPNGMAFQIQDKEKCEKGFKDDFTCECQKNEKNSEDTSSISTIVESIDQQVQTENDDINEEIEEIVEEEVKIELQILRCFIIVVALSFDTILEGLLIGLQESATNVWYLFAVVSVHSASIVFCISLEVFLVGMKEKKTMMQLWLLSGTTTFGVLLGVIISSSAATDTSFKCWPIVILEALCAGTILYVTFFEALIREKARKMCRTVRAISMGAGFSLMALLECLKKEI